MNANPKLVYFIGMPGAGKSYFAEKLSISVTSHYIDLDKTIEERTGFKIAKLFEERGESYFRKLESSILREFIKFGKAIVSTGGGTPCFYNNIQWMKATGKTIWLDPSIDKLIYNLSVSIEQRPLLKNTTPEQLTNVLNELYNYRLPFYKLAKYHLTGDDINIENILNIYKKN